MSARQGTGAGCIPRRLRGRAHGLPADPSQQSLRDTYELGREAVSRQLRMLDLEVVHQEALLSALAGASGRRTRKGWRARPVSSFSRACPRSKWSSAVSERPRSHPARAPAGGNVTSAVDFPRRCVACPRRFRIARGDAAAGGRTGAGARGRRVLRRDGRDRRPATRRRSRLLR